MAEPTKKAPAINGLINALTGGDREAQIRANMCVPPPIGCGGPATEFRTPLHEKEYRISGLCAKCQEQIFGAPIEEE